MTKQVNWIEVVTRSFSLMLLTFCLTSIAQAQDGPVVTSMPAPPPMKFVSNQERSQLEVERDIKKRTQISIRLAEEKLLRAEALTGEQDFAAVINELGNYQGLIDEALNFLSTFSSKKDKTRDTYKKFEITLRSHIVRLETMRRVTPADYADNFKRMIEFVRDARTQALNSFYDDTVIPNEDKKKKTETKSEITQKPNEKAEASQKPNEKPDKRP
jgi:hypothetical protein